MSEYPPTSYNENLAPILEKVMTSEEYSKLEHQTPYLYELKSGDKELFYFGAYHSRDPKDPIFNEIEVKFNEIQPDLVLIEGMQNVSGAVEKYKEYEKRPQGITRDQVIDMSGESGFTLTLAIKSGVECVSPEPKDADMYNSLLEQGFSKEDIFTQQVFLILPQYHRQVERNGFKEYVTRFIKKFQQDTNWDGFDYSYENALAIANKLLGKEIDVENDPQPIDYVDPIPWEDKKESQTVMNRISNATGLYRDRFMVQEISKALKTHKKLFVVFGASHAVMQEPALRELVK